MSKHHGCSCPKCIDCCKREPGWFLPDEIEFAAKIMNLSEKEFIEKYCEEHFEDNIRTISPKRKNKKPECIFLNNGLCEIHEAKPYECRKVYGCEPEHRHKRIRDLIKRQWNK